MENKNEFNPLGDVSELLGEVIEAAKQVSADAVALAFSVLETFNKTGMFSINTYTLLVKVLELTASGVVILSKLGLQLVELTNKHLKVWYDEWELVDASEEPPPPPLDIMCVDNGWDVVQQPARAQSPFLRIKYDSNADDNG